MSVLRCLSCNPSYSVKRNRCAQWNNESEIRPNRNRRVNGCCERAWRFSCVGACTNPSGIANPMRNRRAGIQRAEMTPPAPKNDHQNGSTVRFIRILNSKCRIKNDEVRHSTFLVRCSTFGIIPTATQSTPEQLRPRSNRQNFRRRSAHQEFSIYPSESPSLSAQG